MAGRMVQKPELRIGIVAASCTGKTTLVSALANEIGAGFAAEGAREAAEKLGLGHSSGVCPENAREFQRLVFELKVRFETRMQPFFVSDRTVIDCGAYWLYRELRGILHASRSDREDYFGLIENYLKKMPYHVIFFLEPGAFPWVDDGFRIEDQEPMTALLLGVIAGRFRTALERAGTQIIVVRRDLDTTASRTSFCIATLRRLGFGL